MKTHVEFFKYIGSVHLLPHISVTYNSSICDGCVSIGWLWWGVTFVTKGPLDL